MKVIDLFTEQTTRVPIWNFAKHIPTFVIDKNHHVGDIDGFGIYTWPAPNENIYYVMFENDHTNQALVAIFKSIEFNGTSVLEALVSQKYPGYENRPLLSRLFFFIKSHENCALLIDQRLTDKGLKFIDRLSALGRFQMTWHNTQNGKTAPYDSNTVDQFLDDISPGPWRLLLETSGNPEFWQRSKFFESENIDSWFHWFADSDQVD